jgi:pimeloyl-ACP methyl ester carboxylesterase
MTILADDGRFSAYDLKRTPATACKADQRFSYCLYVPPGIEPENARVLVAIHGTERDNGALRDLFAPLAERHGLIVLAPLFPCGIDDPRDRENYKYIEYGDIRFDHIVLSMVDEVAERYGIVADRFGLFGFSGGAHFAHRFLYLHPQRLDAVSICSPGSVTLLDENAPWWVGVADVEARFGCRLDLPAMRAAQVHVGVGGDDDATWEITHKPGSPVWMDGANDAGVTRVERAASLERSLRAAGMDPCFDVLPGIRHERDYLVAAAAAFFGDAYGKHDVAA